MFSVRFETAIDFSLRLFNCIFIEIGFIAKGSIR
jgi:hypothetical protein